MQKAVAALDDGLIIVQADSKVQYMNDAAAQMADVDSRTSFGEPIQQLLLLADCLVSLKRNKRNTTNYKRLPMVRPL